MTVKNPLPRRTRDADATRAALLGAATEVFAEVGYAGARVDEIAERARVNKRMIYEYFGDKQGLYREGSCRVSRCLRYRATRPPTRAPPWAS